MYIYICICIYILYMSVCVCVFVCVLSTIVVLDYHGNIIMQHLEVAAKLSFLNLLFWNCEPTGVLITFLTSIIHFTGYISIMLPGVTTQGVGGNFSAQN